MRNLFRRFKRWFNQGVRRRFHLWLDHEPVEIVEIETTQDEDGEVLSVRAWFFIRGWANEEDVAVARSEVPLILRTCGLRVRIAWKDGGIDPDQRGLGRVR